MYHTVFQTNHGRKIYIKLQCKAMRISILKCFYVDRAGWDKLFLVPRKLRTNECMADELLDVIRKELDKLFYEIVYVDDEILTDTMEYIDRYLAEKKKYKFLILVRKGDVYATRLKNKNHRLIYLELLKQGGQGVVQECYYMDRQYKRNKKIMPYKFNTIFFEFDKKTILGMVNGGLENDFTNVLIVEDDFGFFKNTIPICGAI